ncbi:MAG: hypothetical protein ACRDLL_00150 [Solirubrobacterales bacterium]
MKLRVPSILLIALCVAVISPTAASSKSSEVNYPPRAGKWKLRGPHSSFALERRKPGATAFVRSLQIGTHGTIGDCSVYHGAVAKVLGRQKVSRRVSHTRSNVIWYSVGAWVKIRIAGETLPGRLVIYFNAYSAHRLDHVSLELSQTGCRLER